MLKSAFDISASLSISGSPDEEPVMSEPIDIGGGLLTGFVFNFSGISTEAPLLPGAFLSHGGSTKPTGSMGAPTPLSLSLPLSWSCALEAFLFIATAAGGFSSSLLDPTSGLGEKPESPSADRRAFLRTPSTVSLRATSASTLQKLKRRCEAKHLVFFSP